MKKKILIVEDDRSFALVLNFLFKGEGYKVYVAHNGDSALEQIHKKSPDLIVLDINLPDINGFKLCEAIKARSDTCDVPVVILTARDSSFDLEKGNKLGASAYLVKPVSHQELLEVVRRHLE
jgi:DNA-binding response OmpR family regulator